MKINRNKLPMKYSLEIYQEIPGYPSHQDLEYILVSTLQETDMLGKDFTAEQVWYGMKHAVGVLPDLIGFLDYSFDTTNKHDTGTLIGAKTSANSYRLDGHQWMN